MELFAEDPGQCMDRYGDFLRLKAWQELDPQLRGYIDPSDAAQQTMLKALQHWHQFRGHTEAELMKWLRTILARHLTDISREFRRKNRQRHRSLDRSDSWLADFLAAEQSTPSQGAMRHEQGIRLADGLASLPEDQRTALELRYFKSLSVNEICQRMGRSRPAVAGLLRRGLNALRILLEPSQ
jgi:RNA polymerase sigma-70 factor (ECF subfamily)